VSVGELSASQYYCNRQKLIDFIEAVIAWRWVTLSAIIELFALTDNLAYQKPFRKLILTKLLLYLKR